jgi:hypothetical protein
MKRNEMTMRNLHRWCVACAMLCVLGLAGCNGNGPDTGTDTQTETETDTETDTQTETETDTETDTEASVGSYEEPPPALTRARFVGGAMAAPPSAAQSGWTAQDAANALYEYGLEWDNGVVHMPTWVQCQADTAYPVSQQAGTYSQFYCRIQTTDHPHYDIRLVLLSSGQARFSFLRWA